MSTSYNQKLRLISKQLCRELKKTTHSERLLWEQIRNRKFYNLKFYRQYPIFYDYLGKETFYIAEFYCYEINIVIEIDGPIHQYKIKADKERTEILEFKRIKVIRFKNEEVEKDMEKVLCELRRFIF